MRASASFTVSDWTPTDKPEQVGNTPMIATGSSFGLAHMVKTFEGDLTGRSITWFLGCLNEQTGAGTYAALEAVEGTLHGRRGAFNIVHAASTHGTDRYDEHVVIVPGSGTEELAGISGRGTLVVEDDGAHRLELEYELG
ncbi:MAG: DUF3224 domain-containing protein [Nocardioides sp.]|nr:DUF3224 domain-containing protein [Nocardioides sp.]